MLELVREARAEGTTVFFSSHILSEVQAVCDRVGIIRDGRLVITQSVGDMIAQRLKRLRLQFVKMPPVGTFDPADVTEMERTDQEILLEVRDNLAQVMSTAAQFGIADIETHNVSLEEIFLTYYGRGNGETDV